MVNRKGRIWCKSFVDKKTGKERSYITWPNQQSNRIQIVSTKPLISITYLTDKANLLAMAEGRMRKVPEGLLNSTSSACCLVTSANQVERSKIGNASGEGEDNDSKPLSILPDAPVVAVDVVKSVEPESQAKMTSSEMPRRLSSRLISCMRRPTWCFWEQSTTWISETSRIWSMRLLCCWRLAWRADLAQVRRCSKMLACLSSVAWLKWKCSGNEATTS